MDGPGYIILAQTGQGRKVPKSLGRSMSSLERSRCGGDHAQDPSRRVLSRATNADSAGAPWGDGSPSSGAFDLDHAHPRDLDGTDAPTSDVSANWCAQPPCTARGHGREILCDGVGNLGAHKLSPKWTRPPRCPRCKADVSPTSPWQAKPRIIPARRPCASTSSRHRRRRR